MLFEYGSGGNRLLELDADGKVVWEHKPPSIAVIFQVLPNGNVLYAYGGKPTGVREVNRQGQDLEVREQVRPGPGQQSPGQWQHAPG